MKVVIDGVEYVPKAEIPEPTNQVLESAIRQLVGIHYLNETHKLRPHVWAVLDTLAPEIAQLLSQDPAAAYRRLHPE